MICKKAASQLPEPGCQCNEKRKLTVSRYIRLGAAPNQRTQRDCENKPKREPFNICPDGNGGRL